MSMSYAEPGGKQAAADYPAQMSMRLQIRRQVREAIKSLQDCYGIRVEMHRHTQSDAQDITHLEKLNLIQAVAALRTVRQELAKYPPEYLQFCDLRRLRLVQTLRTHEPGLQAVDYVGRTYYEERMIYLTPCGEGLYGLAGTLHHELFHLSDSAYLQRLLRVKRSHGSHGSLAAAISQAIYDEEWTQLHPQQEHAYVDLTALPSLLSTQEQDLPGFALAYGAINAWEDRATVAGLLLTAPQAALTKAQRDPVFCRKLTRMMTFYQQRSAGRMDAHYFRDLAEGLVSESYWMRTGS